MPITTVTNTTTITSVKFDEIYNNITDILSTGTNGYGFQGQRSIPTTPGDYIRADNWIRLTDDLQRISVHLYNATQDFGITPNTGTVLTAQYANKVIKFVNTANAVRYARPPEDQRAAADPLVVTSSRTGTDVPWGSTLEHRIRYEWTDDVRPSSPAQYFFNAGGRISFQLSSNFTIAPPYNTATTDWRRYLDDAQSRLSNLFYTREQFIDTVNTIHYAKWGSNGISWSTDPSSYVSGTSAAGDRITVIATRVSDYVVKVSVKFIVVTPYVSVYLNVSNSNPYEYSIDTNSVNGYKGIQSIPPATVTEVPLNSGGQVIYPPPVTKILSISPNYLAYPSFQAGANSITQSVNITNVGNSTCTITALYTNTNIAGLTAVSGPFTLPKSLAPGLSTSLSMYYHADASLVGSFGTTFAIDSNADSHPNTVSVSVNTTAPPPPSTDPFDYILNPSQWVDTITSNSLQSQFFQIMPISGSYTNVVDYSFASPTSNFTVSPSSNGISVQFDPAGKANGNYSCFIYVTAYDAYYGGPVTHGVTISLTLNVDTIISYNLGSWRGPVSSGNSVIGMSYDIIDSRRYLTIGFGTGGDGSTWGDNSKALADSLNYAADGKPNEGFVRYNAWTPAPNTSWCTFVRSQLETSSGYGSWIRPQNYLTSNNVYTEPGGGGSAIGPVYAPVYNNYSVYFPVSGNYSWTYSVDSEGWVNLDGSSNIVDLPAQNNPSHYNQSYSGTKYITQGWHTLNVYESAGWNASTAFQIRDPNGTEVWSTRKPIRSSSPFIYWDEVYRIPIITGQGAKTYQSGDYCIKSSYAYAGQRWDATFGTLQYIQQPNNTILAYRGGMFTISDPAGDGNLTITMNPLYLNSLDLLNYDTYDTTKTLSGTLIGTALAGLYYYVGSQIVYPVTDLSLTTVYYTSTRLVNVPTDNQGRFFTGFTQSGAVRTSIDAGYGGGGSGGGGGIVLNINSGTPPDTSGGGG